MNKQQRYAAIRARLNAALKAIYHNATPDYPREMHGRSDEDFRQWFEDASTQEIDYLGSGGGYGKDYRATLAAPCNAGKYESKAAQQYYVDKGMRAMHDEREDCGMLTGWKVLEIASGNSACANKLAKAAKQPSWHLTRNNSLWEYIGDYGTLYTYGRGGRTLAPAELWESNGCGHGVKFDADNHTISYCVKLTRIVESFNNAVRQWCKSVPKEWDYHCKEQDEEKRAEIRQRAARKAKETKERKYWAARDVITV